MQKERSPATSFCMTVVFTFETAIGYTGYKVLLHCGPLKGVGIFFFLTLGTIRPVTENDLLKEWRKQQHAGCI